MPAIERRRLRKTLENKCGAEVVLGKHITYMFYVGGQVRAQTHVSHGRGQESAGVVATIARQMGITSAQLAALVGCDLDCETYYAILAESGGESHRAEQRRST